MSIIFFLQVHNDNKYFLYFCYKYNGRSLTKICPSLCRHTLGDINVIKPYNSTQPSFTATVNYKATHVTQAKYLGEAVNMLAKFEREIYVSWNN